MGHDPVEELSWHSVYGQVGRRKLGQDPHRHGRFTAIVKQRENGLYRANEKDALFRIPESRYSVPDTRISITKDLVLGGISNMSKP